MNTYYIDGRRSGYVGVEYPTSWNLEHLYGTRHEIKDGRVVVKGAIAAHELLFELVAAFGVPYLEEGEEYLVEYVAYREDGSRLATSSRTYCGGND